MQRIVNEPHPKEEKFHYDCFDKEKVQKYEEENEIANIASFDPFDREMFYK